MILLILLLGGVLRTVGLNQSLWFDEAINVVYAQKTTLWDFITIYPLGDFHPPLWFGLLWLWGRVFGYGETIVRLPSVILGISTIYITYLIGKKYAEKVGLYSALFLAIAPLHIYYSQEARPYSLAAFSVALVIYFFVSLLNIKSKKLVIGYVISTALVLYSDYVAYFIFPAQIMYLAIFNKDRIKVFILPFLLGLLIYSPWLIIFPLQLKSGILTAQIVSGWSEVVGGASVKNFALIWIKFLIGRVTFDNKLMYATVVFILTTFYLIPILHWLKRRDYYENKKLFLSLLILPLVVAFIVSFFVPIFYYFRFLFLLPVLYIILAFGVLSLSNKLGRVVLVILVIFQLSFSFYYLTDSRFHREDWRGAFSYVNMNFDKETVITFENNEIPAGFTYYNNNLPAVPGLKNIPAISMSNVIDIDSFEGKNKIFLFEYLVDITDKQRLLEKNLRENGFVYRGSRDIRGVGLIKEYRK